jgi:hypothetical protein
MPRTTAHPVARTLTAIERRLVAHMENLGDDLLRHPANDALRAAISRGEVTAAIVMRHVMMCLYQVLFLKVAVRSGISIPPLHSWRDVCTTIESRATGTRVEDRLWDRPPTMCAGFVVTFSDEILAGMLDGFDDVTTAAGFDTHTTAYPRLLNYEVAIEPDRNDGAMRLRVQHRSGQSRKQRGSYYTPEVLVQTLVTRTLDPVLERKLAAASAIDHPRDALLKTTVCDPACGSGHFLLAAAQRVSERIVELDESATDRAVILAEVIAHCLYGVDVDPFAVALCKAGLWLHAGCRDAVRAPLDAHIRTGNALLGATPQQIADGIPNDAFNRPKSNHRAVATYYRKRNRCERAEEADDAHTVALAAPHDAAHVRLVADAWCAAFTWPMHDTDAPDVMPDYPGKWDALTHGVFRRLQRDPDSIPTWMREEIRRLARTHRFFHWHLEFPEIFAAGMPPFAPDA